MMDGLTADPVRRWLEKIGLGRLIAPDSAETLRNAFLTTFIMVLAIYPLLDRQFGLQAMGSMNPILIYTILALGLNIVVGFAGLLDLGYAAFFAIGGYTAASEPRISWPVATSRPATAPMPVPPMPMRWTFTRAGT